MAVISTRSYRDSSRLSSEKIPIDTILHKNEKTVESAKNILLQAQTLISRVSSSTEKGSLLQELEQQKVLECGDSLCSSLSSSTARRKQYIDQMTASSLQKFKQTRSESFEFRITDVFSQENGNSEKRANNNRPTFTSNIRRTYASENLPSLQESVESGSLINEIKANISFKPTSTSTTNQLLVFRENEGKLERNRFDWSQLERKRFDWPPNAYLFPDTEKRFKCSDMLFSRQQNGTPEETDLKQKKQKGYLCHVCGKVYCRKYVLKIHQRVHSGEKPLQCCVCGKCFSDPSNMKKHLKLHEAEQVTYPCKYCGRHFIRRRGLSSHIQSVHSKPGPAPDTTRQNSNDNNVDESLVERQYFSIDQVTPPLLN